MRATASEGRDDDAARCHRVDRDATTPLEAAAASPAVGVTVPVAQRLAAQLLSGSPATSVTGVVDRVLAVQAQDLRGARLAVRVRSTGLRASDVDRALTQDRSVVVSWLNRGTLHLVRAEDYWWLHELTTAPQVSSNVRRLRQEGVSPEAAERGVQAVVRALEGGPRSRQQLRDVVASVGVPVAGQALVHVLLLATLRGHVVRGPVDDEEQAFVLTRDWLGRPPAPLERDVALAELARRYLAGHGPATADDLARWAGIRLGEARRGVRALRDLVEMEDGSVDVARRGPVPPLPPPRLLGAFDPLLTGWRSREPIVGEHRSLVTSNGVFRPFALVGGRAVATWTIVRGRVSLTPLEQVSAHNLAALEDDAVDVLRFLAE